MGVIVSKSGIYDLLIVTDDVDHISHYSYMIKAFTVEALAGFRVHVVRIHDSEENIKTVACKKVLFLVDARTNSIRSKVLRWMRHLPCLQESKKGKYLIVNVDEQADDRNDGIMNRVGDGTCSVKVMTVSNLGVVFRWWPRLLKIILPCSTKDRVTEKVNMFFSEVFITESGFDSVDNANPAISRSVIQFIQRQDGFINLLLQRNFRTVQPDMHFLLVNTDDEFSKRHFGKCLRSQKRDTFVFLDRELDNDMLKGFEVPIFTPLTYMNGIFCLMKDLKAIDTSTYLRVPSPPIGPLNVKKLHTSIDGKRLRVFIGLWWKGYIVQEPYYSREPSVTIMIERLCLRSREWAVACRGIDVSQHRYEDSVSCDGVYRYRLLCVNAWGTTSEALISDWVHI